MSRWLAAVLALAACGDNGSPWRPLFDGTSLAGWYSYLQNSHYDDPHAIFRVEDGMIHVLGSDLAQADFELGYLATTADFENFRLRLEYKWGPRNYVGFGPDSGFFIAAVGPDKIWPRSQECQIYVGDSGSTYIFDYATFDTTIDPDNPVPTYLPGGMPYTAPRNPEPNYARVTHSAAYDVADDWNTVEIVSHFNDAEFIVNGETTFRSTRRRQPSTDAPDDASRDVPLDRGKLVIQEEGNEIFFRNIEIAPLY